MLDEVVARTVLERLVTLLEVRLRRLRARSDRLRAPVVHVPRGTELEQVRCM